MDGRSHYLSSSPPSKDIYIHTYIIYMFSLSPFLTHRSVGTWICGSSGCSSSHFPSSPSRLGFTMRTAFWIASSKLRPMAWLVGLRGWMVCVWGGCSNTIRRTQNKVECDYMAYV